ncbi:MAG: radical SAM protein [Candidatus Woesearchaeota archaeon]
MKPTRTFSKIRIDYDKCNLCKKCIEDCPQGVFKLKDNKVIADANSCIGCMICSRNCPEDAIDLTLSKIKKFYISNLCNNNCIMCFNEDKSNFEHPPFNELINEFDDKINGNEKLIVLHGYEPTLRKDFFKILKYFGKRNLKVFFPTNGRIFKYKKYSKKISKLKLDLDIAFTILGSSYKTHDSITHVKNSFNETYEGIKNMFSYRKENITLKINYVILKQNFKEIPKMVKRFYNYVDEIQLSYLESGGHANSIYDKLAPSFNDLEKVFKESFKLDKKDKVKTKNIPLCHLDKKDHYRNLVFTRNNLRTKVKKCNYCDFNEDCPGYWDDYLKIYDV